MNRIIQQLPKLQLGDELIDSLKILPPYSDSVRETSPSIRLMNLENIYNIYIPSKMSVEIYNKLYMSMVHSLSKKESRDAIRQGYGNRKMINKQKSFGLIGGSDSYTIIGTSGIGKSSAIMRSLDLITEERIIEINNPSYIKIIPCLAVQCPFDCSVKGLCLEILRKVDEALGTDFYPKSMISKVTVDMLIGAISQVSLKYIGLLIVDEIQNVVKHKNGNMLVAMLTQLINNSGISICMVGTPESEIFFESADYLARRAIGLNYTRCKFDEYFDDFCTTLFEYQYTKNRVSISSTYKEWLYAHSNGIISNVVFLFHDAQELAILSGKEEISIELLSETYMQRMSTLHSHLFSENIPAILPKMNKGKTVRMKKNVEKKSDNATWSFDDFRIKSKERQEDIVEILKSVVSITEVEIQL